MNSAFKPMCFLTMILPLIGCGSDDSPLIQNPFDAIDAYLAQSMEENGTPGMVLAFGLASAAI